MIPIRLLCCAVSGWLAVVQGADADWQAFRGNDGMGRGADASLPLTWSASENVVWRTPLPGPGSSTPIVIGDRIHVTCFSGYNVPGQPRGSQSDLRLHLLRLDRKTGRIEWTRDIEPKLPEQETIRDGHGYATSTPVADADRVFAFFGKSGVHAFKADGTPMWQTDVGSEVNGWGSGASLLLMGERLIVNASVESEALHSLEAGTGRVVWKLGGIKESWNTPVAVSHGGRTELVLAIHGWVLGVDPETGRERWRCATGIPWYMVPSLVAHDGVVYAIGGRPGGSLAVRLGGSGDVTATHRMWTSSRGSNVSSPLYHEGRLYWMHDNLGVAFCADAKTGEIVYQERLDRAGQVYGSPVLNAGRILYPARNGTIHVVATGSKFERLASNSMGERGEFNASPAVAGDRLFLRSDRYLYCVGQ